MMTTKLVLSEDGHVVHAANCPVQGDHPIPWEWAEEKTASEVKEAKSPDLNWCSQCDPLSVVKST